MQMRVFNNSTEDFYQVWVGVGGREHKTQAFGSLAAGEMSAYHLIPSAYYGYGKVNVTLANMERLPTIMIPSPDQDGPKLLANGRYTLIYEQQNNQWQIRFELNEDDR